VSTPVPPSRVRLVGLVLGLAAFAFLLWGWGGPEGKPLVGAMAAVAALMSIWWMTEAVPLAVTSMLPLVLFPLLGIADARRTPLNYFNEIIVLYIGAFLIALSLERWNLHKRIALLLLQRVGVSAGAVIGGCLLSTALLSMWISNTATALMMLPIGLAVVAKLEESFGADRTRPLALGLMLAIAYGCSIGGIATPVGTPTNLAFLRIYRDTFPNAPAISFGDWMLYATPVAALLLAATWFLIVRVFCRTDASVRLDRAVIHAELQALGRPSFEERLVGALFILVAILWVLRGDLNLGILTIPGWSRLHPALAALDDGTVALLFAVLLFIIPSRSQPGRTLLDGGTLMKIPWDVLLLFGGGFALASGFVSTGLSQHLATVLRAFGGMPEIVMLLLVCMLLTFLTELTSNVATATMILPILAAWAVAEEIHPLILMIPATISASMAFMLPVATPPNAIVFSSRRVRIAEMAKVGLALNLVGVVVIAALSQWLLPAILDFDPAALPAWALGR
jgi:solute carrier family 13 (sodium-dependent dicarboxylate transporter), member 2/3/5